MVCSKRERLYQIQITIGKSNVLKIGIGCIGHSQNDFLKILFIQLKSILNWLKWFKSI